MRIYVCVCVHCAGNFLTWYGLSSLLKNKQQQIHLWFCLLFLPRCQSHRTNILNFRCQKSISIVRLSGESWKNGEQRISGMRILYMKLLFGISETLRMSKSQWIRLTWPCSITFLSRMYPPRHEHCKATAISTHCHCHQRHLPRIFLFRYSAEIRKNCSFIFLLHYVKYSRHWLLVCRCRSIHDHGVWLFGVKI